MSIEYWFLFGCIGILVVVTAALAFNTCIMGSKHFKTFQFIMSSMQYSKEVDDTIKQVLAKMDAELYAARLSPNGQTILFFDAENHDETKSPYHQTLRAEAEIWIATKYHGYGYIHRYYGEQKSQFLKKRPSVSTFREIVKLEARLRGESKGNKAPPKAKDSGTVELV